MTPEQALETLATLAVDGKAEEMAAYHKIDRPYLGVANPVLDEVIREWRQSLALEQRLELAQGLWASNVHEGRVSAAKLLTQARIRPDDTATWDLLCSWMPEFDSWAIADHTCIAIQKRLAADPTRLDLVETWTTSEHMWTRRAAMVSTLPWTKQNHPTQDEAAARDRILGWAATYVTDPDWFMQKSIAWWLRELSKHDAPRVMAFLEEFGATMKPFSRKEAAKKLAELPVFIQAPIIEEPAEAMEQSDATEETAKVSTPLAEAPTEDQPTQADPVADIEPVAEPETAPKTAAEASSNPADDTQAPSDPTEDLAKPDA